MLHQVRAACLTGSALAVLFSSSAIPVGAQSHCAPASRASLVILPGNDATGIFSRTVSLHGRDVSLREALDRLAAAAHIKLSYTSELLPLGRPVCLDYGTATVGKVLADLLQSTRVQPKSRMPAYEMQPTDLARSRPDPRENLAPTSRRVWNVLDF